MSYDDLLDRAVRAASDDPRRVAPEFNWKKNADHWVATSRTVTKERFGAAPRRVVVTPGQPGIYVHGGGEPLTWLAYLNGGAKPRGEDFKRCLAELCTRVGLSASVPSVRSTSEEIPVEPIPPGPARPHHDVWPFKGAVRVHHYQWGAVVRPSGRKMFVPCRPSSIGLIVGTRAGVYAWRDGAWRKPRGGEPREQLRGIPGVEPDAFTTYRSEVVSAAIAARKVIWFCEGEKDVDVLEELGVVADTNPGGAGKLTDQQARIYDGAEVVVVPDNDEPDKTGRRAGIHGADVTGRTLLAAGAANVTILEPLSPPPGHAYKPGYDVADFVAHRLQDGAKPEEIVRDLDQRRASGRGVNFEAASDPSPEPARGSAVVVGSEVAAEVVNDAIDLIDLAKNDPNAIYGIRTGIPRLDHLTLGLHPGLIILAAPPSMGKTTFAQSIALHACKADRVLYLSWEHTAKSLTRRMLCSHAGIDTMELRRGRFLPRNLVDAHRELAPQLQRLDIIETDPALTIAGVRALLAEYAGDRVLVVLDFLQLHAKTAREFRDIHDTRGKVDALAGELLALGHSAGVPILAISSQSRGGDGYNAGKGSANLASLKESGDTEYSADLVLILTKPDDDEAPKGERVLHLVKHREGPTGTVPLVLDLKSGRVREQTSRDV